MAGQIKRGAIVVGKTASAHQLAFLFGDRAVGRARRIDGAGSAIAVPFVDSVGGTASAITVYVAHRSRAVRLDVGLYSDQNGRPGSRLSAGSLGRPAAGAWDQVMISGTRLRAGATYWLAILGSGGSLHLRDVKHGRCWAERSGKRHLRSLPETWKSGRRTQACPISSYVTGTRSHGGGKGGGSNGGGGNGSGGNGGGPGGCGGGSGISPVPSGTTHYLYTVTEGSIDVFNIDSNFAPVRTINLPQTAGHGIRGVAANPAGHVLYVSYGSDSGATGSLLAYDLVTNTVLWTHDFSHGIDSMAITPDGKTIYMPDGELSGDGTWYVVNAATGADTGTTIDTSQGTGDTGPHNTIVSLDGKYAYMGDRNLNNGGSNYFYVACTATNKITMKVGPFQSGIRPFTVNKENTVVYTSVTGFKGFQVGDLTTGKVLYTAPIKTPGGTSCPNSGASDPSHGVSLSPDEKQVYVIDWPCNGVAVFDVSGVPASAPTQIAWIPVHGYNGNQSPCSYDCLGDGWLLHSSDGRHVFVGDSGDVIDTSTRTVVAHLNQLYETRVFIEVDWSNGAPTFTTTRSGLGR